MLYDIMPESGSAMPYIGKNTISYAWVEYNTKMWAILYLTPDFPYGCTVNAYNIIAKLT